MMVGVTEIAKDLKDLRERLDSIIETLEIMTDKDLMESIERARNQPKKREFREFLKELGVDVLSVSD